MKCQGIRTVCIIGAGPSGLSLIKALNAEKSLLEIDLYDSRSKIGGIWNYVPHKSVYNSDEDLTKSHEYNFSPIYNKLETNILHKSMEFCNFQFAKGTDDFPFRTEVLKYLQNYSKTIGPYQKLMNTRVIAVEKEKETDGKWEVTSQNLLSGVIDKKGYDAVIVANGHFEVPRLPEVEGLNEWKQQDPLSVMHAKFYDKPEKYKNKVVLVVGGGSSGSDIAIQCSLVANKVYVSCDETILNKISNKYIELIPRIDSYDVENRSIYFQGKAIEGIDDIIFCTGYLYNIPFLKLDICKSRYIGKLYKQIFYIKDPTLVFVGLAKDVSPFPLGEAQGAVIAKFFSGRLELPSFEDMHEYFKREQEEKGIGLHGLKFPKEAEYVNDLSRMVEEQELHEGLQFVKYVGERFETRKLVPEAKLQRIIETNDKILASRENE